MNRKLMLRVAEVLQMIIEHEGRSFYVNMKMVDVMTDEGVPEDLYEDCWPWGCKIGTYRVSKALANRCRRWLRWIREQF